MEETRKFEFTGILKENSEGCPYRRLPERSTKSSAGYDFYNPKIRLFPAVFVLCAVAGCLIAGVNLLTMHALAATLRRRPRNCPLPAFSLLFQPLPDSPPPHSVSSLPLPAERGPNPNKSPFAL